MLDPLFKTCCRLTWLSAVANSLLCTAASTPHLFQAGAYAVDVTPTNFPVLINGGFLAASASKVTDALHARCLVLDDGATRVGFCVIDSCLIPREFCDEAKVLIQRATGLPGDRIMIAATHSHSAPSIMQVLGTPEDPNYPRFLLARVVEGFRQAVGRLQPARIGWAIKPVPELTHTRIWIRRPDRLEENPFGERTVRANMHPGYLNPDVIGPSGPSDPDLSLVSIQSLSGQPIAVMANYAMHYYGAVPISADYFGRFAERLRVLVGGDRNESPFVGIMSQGYSGDQHWMDYGRAQTPSNINEYADKLAQIAHEMCQRIAYHDWLPVRMLDKDLPLPVRLPDEARTAWARQVVKNVAGRLPRTLPEVYAAEQLWLNENPVMNVKLQAWRIGDLGMTAVSGEVFAITSLKLKAQSPLQPLVNIEVANGEHGYIPPPEHHLLGSYNTWACRTAGLEMGAEPKIVDALLGMLEDLAGKSRRPLTDTHGSYPKMILKSDPLAYWRMNDIEGPTALDATGHHYAGAYENAVAFYLDGPNSPAFSGPLFVNRAAHFAGGRMIASVPRPSRRYSVELLCWNGLPPGVRGVTGELFAWGDQLSIGGTNTAPGRLILHNPASNRPLVGTTELPLKTWMHIVFTRDGSRVSAYLNGELEVTGEFAAPSASPVREIYLGASPYQPGTFEGKLDEVAIWDRPLSAAEARHHFQETGLLPPVERAIGRAGVD